ncbi:MAG: NADH-quinone oxidoreductase subunit J [Elusimicrobium sp.]|jgi:NADH-quinone oxidoreductase subunit J|nr:NADH-quinone oxidoreductase subunit J [Elusimicrobium sp.]
MTHLAILISMVITSVLAAQSRNFIYAAMWLALLSATVAVAMFNMGAPWAAVFELSVCAGLITVLFAGTASMLGKGTKYAQNERRFMKYLPLGLFAFGVCLWYITYPYAALLKPSQITQTTPMMVGDIIWQLRYKDLIGQICMFVAGVLMVKAFFGRVKDE